MPEQAPLIVMLLLLGLAVVLALVAVVFLFSKFADFLARASAPSPAKPPNTATRPPISEVSNGNASEPLGASATFFLCGADLTVSATPQDLRQLASALESASRSQPRSIRHFTYDSSENAEEATLSIEIVETHDTAGRSTIYPVTSPFGLLSLAWLVLLPLIGLAALIWLAIRWFI
jgi:hypothetical protein